MRNLILLAAAWIERIFGPIAAVNAVASAWISFLAYREILVASGLSPSLALFTAGVLGVACAALLYLFYGLILRGIPATSGIHRLRLMPYVVVAAVLIAAFSTYTNLIVTAGGAALERHRSSERHALETSVARIEGAAFSIAQIGPGLQGHAESLVGNSECEESRGCLTGAPGRGDLTDALSSAAGLVGTAARTVTQAEQRIAGLVPQVRERLEAGDEQGVRDLLTEMLATLPLDSLRQTATALRSDLGIEGTSANPDVRRRQNEAIARTQRDLAAIADGVEAALARIEAALDGLVIPVAEDVTKASAIFAFREELVPQIALGLAIDWALIFAALFYAGLRDALPRPEDDQSDLTLEQLRRAKREYDELVRNGADEPEEPAVTEEVQAAPDPSDDNETPPSASGKGPSSGGRSKQRRRRRGR